jgi:hypothetical protein
VAVPLVHGLRSERIRAALDGVHAAIDAAGRRREDVQVLAAVKYVPVVELSALAEAGITLVGENRAQELQTKAAAFPGFTWDFIGNLQSRKVKAVAPLVRYIHSVASASVLAQLERHGTNRTRVLVEVNIADDPGKAGIAPDALAGFLERSPVPVVGLMTMPPQTDRAEDSRRHFAALRELAQAHGLTELSMGTSQDYRVALEEGATIIRLGSTLYQPGAP